MTVANVVNDSHPSGARPPPVPKNASCCPTWLVGVDLVLAQRGPDRRRRRCNNLGSRFQAARSTRLRGSVLPTIPERREPESGYRATSSGRGHKPRRWRPAPRSSKHIRAVPVQAGEQAFPCGLTGCRPGRGSVAGWCARSTCLGSPGSTCSMQAPRTSWHRHCSARGCAWTARR